MVYRRASLFFAGLSPTPRHSISEPGPSILGHEIAPRFSVRDGPSPRFGSSPPPLSGQSGMKKPGVGITGFAVSPHSSHSFLPGDGWRALPCFQSGWFASKNLRMKLFSYSSTIKKYTSLPSMLDRERFVKIPLSRETF